MRKTIDSILGKDCSGPSDLNVGLYRHDDQYVRALPYLRELWSKNAPTSATTASRRKLASRAFVASSAR
ncbi:hypothetical protein J5277_28815 [Rhizobium sp. 16-449-1b]|uniref:hypothetical protein n=1 Tax=Rhizobium sp. 16-449-1b TaxID=2819989 RepID=UPI001ADC3A9F|nr:hypothetical protein [Rhizobium sp. 16-449-1b]MBO9198135.1 hypothetical protein [Rhizobium sp. 16-449-1b]